MSKKKVSIITLQYVDNFGSVLQTYATEYLFRKAGADAEIVDLTRANWTFEAQLESAMDCYHRQLGKFNNPLADLLLRKSWTARYKKAHSVFERFRSRYVHLSRTYADGEDLAKNPPEADIYCSGSDQIWNLEYNGDTFREYFLSYAPENKIRTALSSSFGMTALTEEEEDRIRPYVMKYDMISVREASALDIIRKVGFQGGVHLLDPTLIMDSNDWKRELPVPDNRHGKYVLVYQLNYNPEMIRFAKALAKEKGLKVICITQILKVRLSGVKVISAPEVDEFLSLIRNAGYVITDSFHGTAFSLNFGRQFYIFYPPNYSTRLQSILELTGNLDRVVNKTDQEMFALPSIDYASVNEVLKAEREKAQDFVDRVLSL